MISNTRTDFYTSLSQSRNAMYNSELKKIREKYKFVKRKPTESDIIGIYDKINLESRPKIQDPEIMKDVWSYRKVFNPRNASYKNSERAKMTVNMSRGIMPKLN